MRVDDVILPERLIPEKFTLALLQLRSPFRREADIIRGVEEPVLGWLDSQHDQRRRRFETLLTSLSRFQKRHFHFLVLPEYAVSMEMLDLLRTFSLRNRTVVLGTYYDSRSRVNCAFAIYPQDNQAKIATASKFTRSRFETDVLRELEDSEKSALKLHWAIGEEKLSLLLLPCRDFLSWPDLPPQIKDADILVSPMSSPIMTSFVEKAKEAIRWVAPEQRRERSRSCVLCNSTDLSGDGLRTCGDSRVIGVTRTPIPPLGSAVEGGLVLDINPLQTITVPTQVGGKDGPPVEASANFLLGDDWKVHWEPLPQTRPSAPEVHPNAPVRVGLNKYYSFVRLKRYWRHRSHLRGISTGCSGVYGFHDLLLHSYEESPELVKLRLRANCPTTVWRDLEADDLHCFRVLRTIKFRGTMFATREDTPKSIYRTDDLDSLEQPEVESGLRRIYDYVQTNEIDEQSRQWLRDSCILLDGLPYSDVAREHVDQKKYEYLVFVWLTPDHGLKDPTRIFEEHVISSVLAQDERVRTIEVCESANAMASDYLQAHYVLHVVGYPKDLAEVVLDNIHTRLGNHEVECGTRVVPIAENLSRDPRESLDESRIQDKVARGRICEIIYEVIGERSPFVIKRMDKETTARMSKIWLSECIWEERRREEGREVSYGNEMRRNLARCIYGICLALVSKEDGFTDQDLLDLWNWCGAAYRDIANEVEGILGSMLRAKEYERGSDLFEEELRSAWAQRTKDNGEGLQGIERMALGHRIQSVIYWDMTYKTEPILRSGSIKQMRVLQGTGLADFRDGLAHSPVGTGTAMSKHFRARKDLHRLLKSLEAGLVFILEFKSDF